MSERLRLGSKATARKSADGPEERGPSVDADEVAREITALREDPASVEALLARVAEAGELDPSTLDALYTHAREQMAERATSEKSSVPVGRSGGSLVTRGVSVGEHGGVALEYSRTREGRSAGIALGSAADGSLSLEASHSPGADQGGRASLGRDDEGALQVGAGADIPGSVGSIGIDGSFTYGEDKLGAGLEVASKDRRGKSLVGGSGSFTLGESEGQELLNAKVGLSVGGASVGGEMEAGHEASAPIPRGDGFEAEWRSHRRGGGSLGASKRGAEGKGMGPGGASVGASFGAAMERAVGGRRRFDTEGEARAFRRRAMAGEVPETMDLRAIEALAPGESMYVSTRGELHGGATASASVATVGVDGAEQGVHKEQIERLAGDEARVTLTNEQLNMGGGSLGVPLVKLGRRELRGSSTVRSYRCPLPAAVETARTREVAPGCRPEATVERQTRGDVTEGAGLFGTTTDMDLLTSETTTRADGRMQRASIGTHSTSFESRFGDLETRQVTSARVPHGPEPADITVTQVFDGSTVGAQARLVAADTTDKRDPRADDIERAPEGAITARSSLDGEGVGAYLDAIASGRKHLPAIVNWTGEAGTFDRAVREGGGESGAREEALARLVAETGPHGLRSLQHGSGVYPKGYDVRVTGSDHIRGDARQAELDARIGELERRVDDPSADDLALTGEIAAELERAEEQAREVESNKALGESMREELAGRARERMRRLSTARERLGARQRELVSTEQKSWERADASAPALPGSENESPERKELRAALVELSVVRQEVADASDELSASMASAKESRDEAKAELAWFEEAAPAFCEIERAFEREDTFLALTLARSWLFERASRSSELASEVTGRATAAREAVRNGRELVEHLRDKSARVLDIDSRYSAYRKGD